MSFFDEIFGRKPGVAPLQETDPLAELSKLLGGEIKDWPQIENLSNLFQDYMMGAWDKAIPGFSDIMKQGGMDTAAMLAEADPLIHGQIPEDVKQQVLRSSAFESLKSGTAGGPMAAALTARDLGLTSLDLQQKGAQLATEGGNAAQRWQDIAMKGILPPSASMYSPEWFTDFVAKQRASQQAIAQQRLNVAAAPNPGLQALNQWIEQVGGSIVASYAGGGMGGKGSSYKTSYDPGSYLGGTAGADPMSDVSNPGYYTGGSNPYQSPFNAYNYGVG